MPFEKSILKITPMPLYRSNRKYFVPSIFFKAIWIYTEAHAII